MNDATNVLVMVPLCFTAFGVFVSILGLIGARCSNKWLVLGHSSLALPCIVGFAAVGIITGIWLAGFEILELSLKKVKPLGQRLKFLNFKKSPEIIKTNQLTESEFSSLCSQYNQTINDPNFTEDQLDSLVGMMILVEST